MRSISTRCNESTFERSAFENVVLRQCLEQIRASRRDETFLAAVDGVPVQEIRTVDVHDFAGLAVRHDVVVARSIQVRETVPVQGQHFAAGEDVLAIREFARRIHKHGRGATVRIKPINLFV